MQHAPLDVLAQQLETGDQTSLSLVEACLARIDEEGSEADRAFVQINREQVRAEASAMDILRAEGKHPSPYAGIPISIKDLFDVRGEVTKAGSKVLAGASPAQEDAPAIANLRAAGFLFIGRTNMTEFAYSGLGLNPHYGTPLSPYKRDVGHIPGGSSSGAAVSVSDGFAAAAIGTDTGGSCRIPAAFCGIVGYKPSAQRISREGASPLSSTLDSIGPLASDVRSAEILDAILAGESVPEVSTKPLSSFRFAVPLDFVLDDMDESVLSTFARTCQTLAQAGATLAEIPMPELLDLPRINQLGGFAASEAFHWHRSYLETQFEEYDPRVSYRIVKGRAQTADDYLTLLDDRRAMITSVANTLDGFDCMLMPTVPVTPPELQPLIDDEEAYMTANMLALRNPSVINFLDGCALSIPAHEEGDAPVGLMIAGLNGADRTVFAAGHAIEGALS